MKAKLLSAIVFCVVAMSLTLGAYAQGATTTVGQIKAVRVVGDVKVVHAANPTAAALSNNDAVAQGDVIITAKQSSVVLVFSNGSTMSLGQDSKLAIDEFLQDPFAETGKVAETKEEPSTSHTKLALTYGELVGHVRKLKGESTFLVQTPVGAAGIRGTTFRVVYRPSGKGKAFFSLSVTSGVVIFQAAGAPGASPPVAVTAGHELTFQVTIDPVTGAVSRSEETTAETKAGTTPGTTENPTPAPTGGTTTGPTGSATSATTEGTISEMTQPISQGSTDAIGQAESAMSGSDVTVGLQTVHDEAAAGSTPSSTPNPTPTPTPPPQQQEFTPPPVQQQELPRTTPGGGQTG